MVIVGVLAAHFDARYRQNQIRQELKQQSFQTLQLVSAGAQEAVIVEDIAMLNTLVEETSSLDDDLVSMHITNESGQTMVRWDRPGHTSSVGTYEFDHPIAIEGELFGTVEAFWDPSRLSQEVGVRLQRSRRTMMLALVALTVLSLFMLHRFVTSPLQLLSNRLSSISQGKKTEPLEITSSREMSMLANAVNDLVASMDESSLLAKELEFQATHDLLTGLKNRHAFEATLRQHLSARTRDSGEAVLLYFDLDQFKIVNDTCGHAAGDALLTQLAARLAGLFDKNDTFARLGGDEFAVLLPDLSLEEGLAKAEELRVDTQDYRFTFEGKSFVVEASIGVVKIDEVDEKLERIMTAADEACYGAKEAGRNRVQLYEEDDNDLKQRRGEMSWVPRIHEALETSRLVLYGQTISPTDPVSPKPAHIEVLVRMTADNGDLTPPGAFLPAAERYGIMPHIDRWVISNTIKWMEEEISNNGQSPLCAINVSAVSMSDANFRLFLLELLGKTEVPCTSICFEMTETAAVANLASTMEFMNTVKSSGCQFALDDFGSGMSSFMYLKNLPVDFVKIDGAFVSPMLSDKTSVVMVRAIADIARVMGIETIAEFVENDEIRDKLGEIGIDYVQGFGVGKPQPLTDFSSPEMLFQRAA